MNETEHCWRKIEQKKRIFLDLKIQICVEGVATSVCEYASPQLLQSIRQCDFE